MSVLVSTLLIGVALGAAYLAWRWIPRWFPAQDGQRVHSVHQTTVTSNVSMQAVKVPGPASNPKQLVVRRANWKDKKERTEYQAARTFCDLSDRPTWQLVVRPQNDPVDIKAVSLDGQREDLQIVRLWEDTVWKDLNTKGAVDRSYSDQEVIDLLRRRLDDKGLKKYPDAVRSDLVLLIDANPIESVSNFLAGVEDTVSRDAKALGYKAVWIVGTIDVLKVDQ